MRKRSTMRDAELISESIKIEARAMFDSLVLNNNLMGLKFAGIKFRRPRKFRENCETQSLGHSRN